MDIKVVNCVTVTPPPSSGTEPYPVFTLQVRSGHWNWQIVRNFFQIDHFNTEAAKIVKDLAKLPPKAIDENTKASLTEYFSTVCSKEELEPLLQDRLVSSENAFSECEALATPASYSGVLEFSADKKKWETKWCSLREDTLYAFNEKEYDDRKPRFLPKFTIALLNATINPVGANEVEIATAFGNSFYLRAATTADRDAWASSLITNSAHEEGDRRALSPSQQTKLNDLKALLGAAYEPEYDDRALTRYLVEHQWNVDSVNLLVQNDKIFREEFNVKGLKIASIYESFKGGKCFYTGYRDKAGRPIIVFRAAKHDPNADYMETMKLVIYSCERAIEAMGDDTEQATLVYDLNGFERKHQDNRTIKLLLEMVQAHYPHRIGLLLAVSAPWLFRLVFKVIRPWLSEDLVSKVHIYGDTAQMAKYINPDQLLREYGGTATFDLEAYASSRAAIEGLALATAGIPAGEHQFLNDEIISRFSDCPADKTIKDAIIHGWLKKQAGWVKRFNKRYCILKGSVLYYYAGKKDARAEGVVPLRSATFVPEGLNFHIITKSGKDCVFSVEKKERDAWFNNLQELIVRLGGTVKEAVADAAGEENSLDVLNSSGQWKAAANPDIVIALLGRLRGIVQANVSDGKLNVDALKASPEFSQFEQATCELQKVELAKLSEPIRAAFFLNLYHLLLVHAQIKIGNATDADTRFNLFNSPCYVVDGLYFTLQDISHGILRSNVCHPSRLGFSKHFLEVKKDPRVKYIVKAVDPRIHFAINANHWCNTLEYVVPFEDLENQLNLAASNYLRSVVEVKDDHAVLPILVNWFAGDFGKSEAEIKTYLSQFLDDARKDLVKNAPGVYYKSYDWSNLGIASLL